MKWVNRSRLRGALPDWTVKMYGLKRKNGTRQTSTLDRLVLSSCAAPGCHGRVWVSSRPGASGPACTSPTSWAGSTAGRPHGDDAFNLALAMRGYRIKLVSDRQVRGHQARGPCCKSEKIILANKRDGVELPAKCYPLRLVGPYVDSSKFIGRITKIYMLPK